MPASRGQHALVVALAALVLCLLAVVNGQPFFYPDTPTYLRGAETGVTRLAGPGVLKPWLPAAVPDAKDPEPAASAPPAGALPDAPARPTKALTSVDDKIVLAGRSVYYGLLVYAGYLAGGMWLTIAAQALAVAYVLHLLMVRLWSLSGLQTLGIVAALGLLTPLGAYTGLLMPDVFAGVAILVMAMLAVYWQRLSPATRWILAGLLLYSLCVHASHVALAAALLVVLMLFRWLGPSWRALPLKGVPVVLACIVVAVAAEAAFSFAVKKAVGEPPLRLPHLTARLIDMGPGTDYLRRHCPGAGFATCAYVANYPTRWDDFLFSTEPGKGTFALVDADTKRRLAAEQLRFALAVLRHDPIGVVSGIGADVLRQLVTFRVDTTHYRARELAMYLGRVPEDVYQRMQASPAGTSERYSAVLTLTTYATVFASLVLGAWLWGRGRAADPTGPGPTREEFGRFAALVIAGVMANAVVCGTFASSLDRFQARVVWLLPLLALAGLILAARRSTRRAPEVSRTAQGGRPASST